MIDPKFIPIIEHYQKLGYFLVIDRSVNALAVGLIGYDIRIWKDEKLIFNNNNLIFSQYKKAFEYGLQKIQEVDRNS